MSLELSHISLPKRKKGGISDSAEVGKCGDRGAPLPEWHALRV